MNSRRFDAPPGTNTHLLVPQSVLYKYINGVFRWYLQGYHSVKHIFSHAYFHIKLSQLFLCLCAGGSPLLAGRHKLGEIKNMA